MGVADIDGGVLLSLLEQVVCDEVPLHIVCPQNGAEHDSVQLASHDWVLHDWDSVWPLQEFDLLLVPPPQLSEQPLQLPQPQGGGVGVPPGGVGVGVGQAWMLHASVWTPPLQVKVLVRVPPPQGAEQAVQLL